ncbi:MAG: diguanylate cyclase [Dehalococcoidia bacterium]|nr:diguanylate cyclase [Dehalococcoidia bacterium]
MDVRVSILVIATIATIAYIPLFVVLLSNRPWNRKQRFFFLFLVPAILWSFVGFLGSSDFFMPHKLVLAKVALCLLIWMLVQLHYFICSFYQSERIKIPWAYIFPVATIVLAALGYIPRGIEVTASGVVIDYGPWIFAIGLLFLSIVGVKDVYSLIQKYRLSPNPAERNQIVYLLAAIAILAVFLLGSVSPPGGEFPVSHIGNLIVACVLTYAVVTHRLLDIRVVFRRALIYVVLYGAGLAIVVLFFRLAYQFVGFELNFASLAITIGLGIPAVLFFGHKLRDIWQRKVEEAFIGARYSYRRQLSQFITRIHNVPTLEQLGSEFILLLAQSLDCRRACLLLPQDGDGGFNAQFTYPPVEDNPIGGLTLRQDSPVVTWLKHESTILAERDLDIVPEFQSIWQEEREEIRSAGVKMFVPLMNKGRLVAVVVISERRDGNLYAVEDIDLLEFITAQVAASMEKEYSRERLREQDEEVTLLNRLVSIVTSSVSIQMIFEGFAQELKKVVDIDWATINLIEGSELYFLALSTAIGSAWQTDERIPLEGTATELACRERRAVYEPDLKRHHRFWTWESHLQQGVRSVVYLPLIVTDRNIGSLVLASRKPNAYSSRQIKLLEKVALQIAAPIENAQLYAQLEQKSRIDGLTGLFNRRHFEERLNEEVSRHSRYGNMFSIFMIDLDNFKAYNDTYGHPAGDILLGQIGKIIKSSVRNVDHAFRYGGDEFVVILPQTARDDAYVVAERVRGQIAVEMEKKAITVTCSIGLASYPTDGAVANELVDAADNALYHAKRTGGNRIILSSKILSEPLDDGGIPGIDTRRDSLSAVYALVSAVETRDPYTYGHSKKVKTYAVALAEAVGLSPDEVSKLSTAALLHDIGKIGIPDNVLNKKGKLNGENWEAIKAHPRLGANIVSSIPNLVPCASSILHHHERWDGGGYPEGLKGEEIPLGARILAIADSFEAMTSPRPYRPAWSLEEVVKELRQGAGTQFDPKLVEVFIGIIEAGLPGRAKMGQDSSGEQTGP